MKGVFEVSSHKRVAEIVGLLDFDVADSERHGQLSVPLGESVRRRVNREVERIFAPRFDLAFTF